MRLSLTSRPVPAFPNVPAGRLPHSRFRGLLSVHSRCGPHGRWITLGDPLHRSASNDVVTSIIRSDCYRLERQFAGRDSHPLRDGAFPRHTVRNQDEACIERITEFYRAIDAAGVLPVSVGGDHSITGGVMQAIAGEGARLTGGRKAAFLHFDAHTDAYEQIPHFLGAVKSAAHWASYLVRDGYVDAGRSVQIGMRGNPRTLDWRKPSEELGYEVVSMDRYRELGPDETMALIDERIGDSPLYITFDLDCLDPTVAPAVANLEAGCEGFRIDEVMRLLRCVRGKNVIGGDVVCLMPTKDHPNQITAHTAAAVMFEVVSLVADRFRG